MDEPFIITVFYKGKEQNFEAQLFTTTYTFKIQVTVNETEVFFERDDEGNFRALAATPDDRKFQSVDADLIKAIAGKIEEILS